MDYDSPLDVDPSLALCILLLFCLILHVYTSSRHLTFDDNISHDQNVVSICLLKEGVFSTIPISISLHESGIFAWRTRMSPVKGISFREYSFIEISAVFRYMSKVIFCSESACFKVSFGLNYFPLPL